MVSLWHFLLVAQKDYKNLVLVDDTKMTLGNSTKNQLLMMKIFNFLLNTLNHSIYSKTYLYVLTPSLSTQFSIY